MINKNYMCDYCFNQIPPIMVHTHGYPVKALAIYRAYFDNEGNHICEECYSKIEEYYRTKYAVEDSIKRAESLKKTIGGGEWMKID